jgi:hypothetical protein
MKKRARSRRKRAGDATRWLFGLAKGAPSVDVAISTIAERFLEGIPCPPTDLKAVMCRLPIVGIEPVDDMDGAGALLYDEGGMRIVYSCGMPETRKRWTIAHEMGHAVFLDALGRDRAEHDPDVERFCDRFASEILMPHRCFAARARERLCLANLFQLATLFQTSLSATAIRYAEVCGVSIFTTQHDTVLWGCGLVRRTSDLNRDSLIPVVVASATRSQEGQRRLPLTIGNRPNWWMLEWRRLATRDRTIFMLHEE